MNLSTFIEQIVYADILEYAYNLIGSSCTSLLLLGDIKRFSVLL